MKMSLVQSTLIEQLKSLNVYNKWKVKNTIYNTNKSEGSMWDLRLCIRDKGLVVNIDFTFDRGQDLYDVKAYLIRNSIYVDKVYDVTGMFWDQLHEIVDRAMANAGKTKAMGTITEALKLDGKDGR